MLQQSVIVMLLDIILVQFIKFYCKKIAQMLTESIHKTLYNM